MLISFHSRAYGWDIRSGGRRVGSVVLLHRSGKYQVNDTRTTTDGCALGRGTLRDDFATSDEAQSFATDHFRGV